jgi:hypothetical protein
MGISPSAGSFLGETILAQKNLELNEYFQFIFAKQNFYSTDVVIFGGYDGTEWVWPPRSM